MTSIRVLATGKEFYDSGLSPIEPALERLVRNAQKEIHSIVYVITEQGLPVLSEIESALKRGVRVRFVINRLNGQNPKVKRRLLNMASAYQSFEVYDYDNSENKELHAKLFVADRSIAILGSSNLSWGGLIANYEIGVLIEGEPAWLLANAVDMISRKCKRVNLVDKE